MKINIGDSGREINLSTIKMELLGKKISFERFCSDKGMDESEVEELRDLLAGEIEICPLCGLWKETSEMVSGNDIAESVCHNCSEGLI